MSIIYFTLTKKPDVPDLHPNEKLARKSPTFKHRGVIYHRARYILLLQQEITEKKMWVGGSVLPEAFKDPFSSPRYGVQAIISQLHNEGLFLASPFYSS